MKLVLLGFMGSGKSSVGAEIARLSSERLIELDNEIIKLSSYENIPEIFENEGEEKFRELENQALRAVAKEESFILSPGGGVIEREDNRNFLKELQRCDDSVTVVFLDTSFAEIKERIGDPESRPLFRDEAVARARFESRAPLYREFSDLILPTEGHSPVELAEVVLASVGHGLYSRLLWSVIGNPVGHSCSPRLHNNLLQGHHVRKGFFSATRVRSLDEFMVDFRDNNALRGLAVTIPFKEEILPCLHEVSEAAQIIGAVNTVVKQDGKLYGDNTDWIGIDRPIRERVDLKGKKFAVLGAGGTARAALYAGREGGAQLTVINRSSERGQALAQEWGAEFLLLSDVITLHDFDVVVHTTSVGLHAPNESLFNREAFREGMVVLDAVYVPEQTKLLIEANAAGASTISGIQMFCAQAEAQYTLHHEIPVTFEEVKIAFQASST